MLQQSDYHFPSKNIYRDMLYKSIASETIQKAEEH